MGEKRLAAILGPLVLAQGGQLCTYREWELDGYGVVIRAPTGQEFRIWRMLWPRPGLKQCPCYLTLIDVMVDEATWQQFLKDLNHVRTAVYHEIISEFTERIENQ